MIEWLCLFVRLGFFYYQLTKLILIFLGLNNLCAFLFVFN